MPSITGGVKLTTGAPVPTKRRLKEIIHKAPDMVQYYSTSPFNPASGVISELPEGTPLYITGPDPETTRTWYATVVRRGTHIKVT